MQTTNDAATTYNARRNDIAILLDAIHQGLDTHAAKATDQGVNWGHAGDLGEVRSRLIGALSFLTEMSSAALDDLLADDAS